MKMNLWSLKTDLSVFAVVVVGLVLFEHLRGVESGGGSTGVAAAAPEKSIRGAEESENRDRIEQGDVNQAIRKSADDFVQAFNRGDAAAIAALWTVNGEYLDGAGQRFVGREAIEPRVCPVL